MYSYYDPYGYYAGYADLRPVAQLGTFTYVVKPGDTLFNIARNFNTTVDIILKFNHIPNPTMLFVGQTIVIPESPAEAIIYIVRPGDTLYSIAHRYGTSVNNLITFNYLTSTLIYPGQRLVVTASLR